MKFDEEFGAFPKFLIRQVEKHGELPEATQRLLPVEVRTRERGVPDFDTNGYFRFVMLLLMFVFCATTQANS